MIALEKIHAQYVYGRRVSILSKLIEPLVPTNALLLDLGCGDGIVGHQVLELRGDIRIYGAEVLLRSKTFIPALSFDGWRLPFGSEEFDVVMMIDVLHHTLDLSATLHEATRVSKNHIIVKDHLVDRFLAKPILRFMDVAGNLRHGVNLPYDYLSKSDWHTVFQQCDLRVDHWDQNLRLYPWWANWLFGQSLHFITRLHK